MIIGIDASRAAKAQRTGTEGYSYHVIRAMLAAPGGQQFRLYFNRAPGSAFPGEHAEWCVIPARRAWTHLRLANEVTRRPPDVLFVPAHVVPLRCPCPSVATIHDLGYLWHPEAYGRLEWWLLHLGTLRNARSARVIADSQATADDLVRHLHVSPERIRVVSLGCDGSCAPASPAEQERVRLLYGLPKRYVLCVGTLQPRKNLHRLVAAFDAIRRMLPGPITLALAGRPGRGSADLARDVGERGLADTVHFLGFVAPADLPALYSGALALAYPSLYEGFGLPVLEAMACGVPVIASNRGSLPEVVGEAGLIVDPSDITGWAQAIALLTQDDGLRADLRSRGLARARQFTWERCGRETLAVIHEAIES